nr:MAG TPA: hypothetical protein [Bacteriophage sp.]
MEGTPTGLRSVYYCHFCAVPARSLHSQHEWRFFQ